MPQEAKIKHLEFLQAVIARMASNSFTVKGWSVALGTAVLGFSVKENNWAMALVAIIPATAFWGLDAYYLGLERLFRDLWTRTITEADASFNLNPGSLCADQWAAASRRPAVLLVHLPVIVAAIVASGVMFLLHHV